MYLIRLTQKKDLWKNDQSRPSWIDGASISLEAFVGGVALEKVAALENSAALASSAREQSLAAISQSIRMKTLRSSEGELQVADCFDVQVRYEEGDAARSVLVILGDLQDFEGLCQGTTFGTTLVCGSVGDQFGAGQRGGDLLLIGDAGSEALMDKREGWSLIHGNVGDRFAGPAPGDLSGMRGGDTMVLGDVGDRACERMRRGSVYIQGRVGEFLAHSWIAGTIYVDGELGRQWCTGMRRGSLLLREPKVAECGASLSMTRSCELSFLPILWKHIRVLVGKTVKEFRSPLFSGGSQDDSFCDYRKSCRIAESPEADTTVALERFIERLPTSNRVVRCFGDLERDGQGEVLVFGEFADMNLQVGNSRLQVAQE
jgi:formylmethanofuran dehydrogenase subunit C